MKNRIKFAVSIILIAMVFASGCAAKSTSNSETAIDEDATGNYIALAKSKLEASSSFESDFYAEVQIGENPKIVTNAKVQMVYEPLAVKIKTQDLFAQGTTDSETYLEKVDTGVNMYMAYDGEWTEMTLDEKNAMKSLGMYYDAGKGMGLLLATGENWVETSEKSGIVTITGDIPAEKVYEVSEAVSFLQLAGMNGVDESYYSGVEAVPVEIQLKEDGTPISFTIDLTKTLETVMNHVSQALAQDDSISVHKYLIKHNIFNLNEVKKIEIPTAARGAINYEKEISLLESSTDEQ